MSFKRHVPPEPSSDQTLNPFKATRIVVVAIKKKVFARLAKAKTRHADVLGFGSVHEEIECVQNDSLYAFYSKLPAVHSFVHRQ